MSDRVYFTGSDAELVFLNHPEREPGQPLDAAHYQLTAGSSPVHIWNYAREEEGGAPFDDTATGNHLAELQLVMNQRRFEETEAQFRAHPNVGDMLLLYETHGDWGTPKTAGYKLLDGHVGSTGEEVTLRNATYPTISLKFKEAVPHGGESQQQTDPGSGDVLELRGEDEPPRRAKFWPVDGYYLDNGTPKAFAPNRSNVPTGDPLSTGQFVRFKRQPVQYVRIGNEYEDIDEWLSGESFVSAFIEVGRSYDPDDGGRELYAWHTGSQLYQSTGRTSPHLRSPIIDAQ